MAKGLDRSAQGLTSRIKKKLDDLQPRQFIVSRSAGASVWGYFTPVDTTGPEIMYPSLFKNVPADTSGWIFSLRGSNGLFVPSGFEVGSLDAAAIVSGVIAYARLPVGSSSGTVAAGNHKHARTTLLTATHTINTSTTPRVTPGTSAHALTALAAGNQVALINLSSVSSDGITWWQCFSEIRGVAWYNGAHLTAV